MELKILNHEELFSRIGDEFNFHKDADAILLSIISEYLRAAISVGMTNRSQHSTNFEAVSTISITRPVRARLALIFAASILESYSLVDELNILQSINELVKSDKGWSLTPLRLVEIDSNRFLMMGGGPIQTYSKKIRSAITFTGRARIILRNDYTQNFIDTHPKQYFLDSIRCSTYQLALWKKAFLAKCSSNMVPTDSIANALIYRAHRWVNIDNIHDESACVLFRVLVNSYNSKKYFYGLGKIIKASCGNFKIVASTEIFKEDARRLQALICESKPQATYNFDNELLNIRIPYPLPTPEINFLNFGWVKHYGRNKKWPKEYIFSRELFPLIEKLFLFLDFELIDKHRSVEDERVQQR